MLLASLTTALLAAAAPAATAHQTDQTIIVTGRNIQDKKSALDACLARQCPTDEDIDASLALAETQLIAGKYHEARTTLLRALGRNKRFAMSYPIPVSDLYRANGRVAAHLGIDSDYYRSTWGIYTTLKKGVPNAKDLQYSAMMEVAEMVATTRGHDRAREYYRSIAYHARADGRPDIAALAELRMILRHWPAYAREDGIRQIAQSADPKTRAAQLEARLALARMAFERNDTAKGEAIVAELAQYDMKKPILVFAPQWAVGGGPSNNDARTAIENGKDSLGSSSAPDSQSFRLGASNRPQDPFSVRSPYGTRSVSSTRMGINVEDMWVDVAFRITPGGKVSDVQVLRSRGDTSWSRPLLASIAGRRYTPPRDGSANGHRTERYTYTSGLEQGTGSHRSQHSPDARVEYFDLSDISAPN
jgi:hypothetical protein